MELRPSSLVFKVHRREPELIKPAKSTPRELKILSDIDDQEGLRQPLRAISFYRHNPSLSTDPVRVIRRALAEMLVYCYPVAGRLREGPHRKLMVECTGEGVVFTEADADVALDELEDALHPPFPCLDELVSDVGCSICRPNSPLLLIQVTRLKCGGFIFAYEFIHVMFDAIGLSLFLKGMGELARGANVPSVPPVWDRHLLSGNLPAHVTHSHREYDEVAVVAAALHEQTVQRSFFFGPKEISALYRLVPADLCGRITSFELLASLLWRCRTTALRPFSTVEARFIFPVNVRKLFNNPPLPRGYYGNAIVFPTAIANAKELSDRPMEYALRLVHEAKSSVTHDYVRSTLDLMASRGRPLFAVAGTYLVSDTRHFRVENADFGWGLPVYGGVAEARIGDFDTVSFLVPYKNKKGDMGVVVPIILPASAMQKFAEELARVFHLDQGSNRPIISST